MKVGAVIVAYNPDAGVLREAAESLLGQVRRLYVIDNGSAGGVPPLPRAVRTIPLGENRGIAAATNIGLRLLAEEGCDWIITSDQDTVYPPDYVPTFGRLLEGRPSGARAAAAFVPVFYDRTLGRVSRAEVKAAVGLRKVRPSGPYTRVFQAIASGMVLNAALLGEIGGMREDLFIDCVDTEWCWRANAMGKDIICCRDLRISHRLGDGAGRIGRRRVALHSPVRNYYITRNSIYLALHTAYLGPPDRALLFIKSLRFVPLYTLLCPEHLLNLRLTLAGVADALRGRLGEYGAGRGGRAG